MMWMKIVEMNEMNEKLMQTIQKKKRLREQLKRIKQKQETEEMVCEYLIISSIMNGEYILFITE